MTEALAATRTMHVRPSVVALGLAAAMCFALGSVLQHRAAALAPSEECMRPALLRRLVARPSWLLANVANLLAFALQLLAVRRGSLLVVQSLLVTTLLFALPAGAALAHRPLTSRDWVGALTVVGGLAVFLFVAKPTVGDREATLGGWLVVALTCGIPAVLLAEAGHRSEANLRATYLAAAAGIVYGVTAALTKESADILDRGLWHTVVSWEPYALIALALGGLLLSQSAFQSGALKVSLPLLTLGEPLVASVIAVVLFHESVVASPVAGLVEVLAVGAMAVGVVLLARSPLVAAGV